MKLDRIHQISEIIASIAIVASLIFVGVQLNQNAQATSISNAQAALDSWSEQGLAIATNPHLSRMITEELYPGLRELQPEFDAEQMALLQWTGVAIRAVESNFLQWRNGDLSDEIWSGYETGMFRNFVAFRNFNEYWDSNRDTQLPEFRDYFDDIQARAKKFRDYVLEHGEPPPA
jgi:hypothetical protein